MHVGFTGTREGCTPSQGGALARWIRDNPMTALHHGCCLGADTEAVSHVNYYQPGAEIVAHPSNLTALTSTAASLISGQVHDNRPPLDRNRDIVDACDLLLACPKGPEERRSGTWATIRYARKQGKRILILWPDGTTTEEGS